MPFTDEQREIVKSTVPLLETGGVALTTHFYKMMLSEYPEVRVLFNQAHQESGAQPRALAQAVLCYAKYIDRLENLGDLVARIIHKHVALNVLPEQYPIVGSCLLRSIREVLGPEIATDAVIDAWAGAYGQLADLLIKLEEDLYAKIESAPGGWRGTREFVVSERVRESDTVTSFRLTPADGGEVISCTPGQYLGLSVKLPDGSSVRRNYSVSSPCDGNSYRISVKRIAGGVVSCHLHETALEGTTLEVFPPAGAFSFNGETTRHVVLISGGVGATPLIPMLHAAIAAGKDVTFIHSAHHGGEHPFKDEVEAALGKSSANGRHHYVYTRPRDGNMDDAAHVGRCTEAALAEWIPDAAACDFYFLGPIGFMKSVRAALKSLAVPDAQVKYEFFGPHGSLEESTATAPCMSAAAE